MKSRKFVASLSAAVAIATLVGAAGAAGIAEQPRPGQSVVQAFERANPGAKFYQTAGRVTSVYGSAFSFGASAVESARSFVNQYAGLFNVTADDLVPGSLAGDGAHLHELMPDLETGVMRFTLVSYLQTQDGIPVFRGNIRLLTRNEAGSPLVLARSGLRDIGNFRPDEAVAANPNVEAAFADAMLRFPGMVDFTPPSIVIFAGIEEENVAPRLAISFVGSVASAGAPDYQKWLIIADAATGQTLWTENQILHVDVTGNVSAVATPGKKADICENEVSMAMPHARVSIGATIAYADVNGNFTIPNAGSTNVTVTSGVRGRYFRVVDFLTSNTDVPALTLDVTPPGPANFVHNAANTVGNTRSAVNAYINANIVRDYTLHYHPTYPVIAGQTEFTTRLNANLNGSTTCNAFYDGSSINFFRPGNGCPSTAFGDVVHHEYGHHLVQVAGSGQGAYGEGMGDVMGVLISDDPILGYGFTGNCSAGIRTANNNLQYPCSGGAHDCGQLISGCVWSTRNALIANYPSTYRDIISSLAINSMPLHDGSAINPQITIDYLTLDDNNANINDGTPHYQEIATGFGAHNMDAPPLQLLAFAYPTGRPATINPAGGDSFTVQVTGLAGIPQANSGVLFVDPENNGTYVQYPMTEVSTNVYSAVFPAIPCDSTVRYYVSASTTTSAVQTDPVNAPTSYFTTVSANSVATAFSDNFQSNQGWTVTNAGITSGAWERAVPNAANTHGAAPTADADGSGMCYVTDNRNGGAVGDFDIDGGTTTLTSPTINATGTGTSYVSYSRWFSNDQGAGADNDQFIVQISGNNGGTWQNLEVVQNGSSSGNVEMHGGWFPKRFAIPAALATTQFRIRFALGDTGTGSVCEGAVDGVRVETISCSCPGDYDGDGFVTGVDYDLFVADFEAGDMDADFDGDGFLTGADFDQFVAAFEAAC